MTVMQSLVALVAGTSAGEQNRLNQRLPFRSKIAAARLDGQLADEIGQRVAKVDEADDIAVNEHQAACKPLQREIADLERQALTALESRQLVPPNVAMRLSELRGKIDEHNSALQAKIDSHKKLRNQLQDDQRKARLRAIAAHSLEAELTRYPLANPALLREQFLATQGVEWGSKRLAAAVAKTTELQSLISHLQASDRAAAATRAEPSLAELVNLSRPRGGNNSAQIAELELRHEQWGAEVEEAQKQIDAAHERAREIRAAMIDE